MEETDEPIFDSEALIDPELDFRSERFNPLKALYSPDTPATIKNVKLYDNLAQFESFTMNKVIFEQTYNNKKQYLYKCFIMPLSSASKSNIIIK